MSDADQGSPREVAKAEQWIQVRVSKADHARLKNWAAKNSTSVSYVVRRLVERTLRQDEDKAGTLP